MTDLEDLLSRTLSDERRSLPLPPNALASVRHAERRLVARRRAAVTGSAVALAGLMAATALAFDRGDGGRDDLLPGEISSASAVPSLTASTVAPPTAVSVPGLTSRPSPSPQPTVSSMRGVAGRVTGVVVDVRHQPLVNVRLMSLDLLRVLGRTRADGSFSTPCQGLVLAPYAFGKEAWPGERREPEQSPGLGNYAFRTLPAGFCGRRVAVTMPPGGVVEGRADAPAGRPVWLSRVVGGNDADGTMRFGDFETKVRADGTYRIEGLATGRYSIESSYEGFPDEATFVDVHEGQVSDGSYTYYQDPAVCHENPGDPSCAQPSPSPQPPPTPTS